MGVVREVPWCRKMRQSFILQAAASSPPPPSVSSADTFPARGKAGARPITKDAISHYVYAVLQDPIYRETYALNQKREFPRIPFYPDFWEWAAWVRKADGLTYRLSKRRALAAQPPRHAGRSRPRGRRCAKGQAEGRQGKRHDPAIRDKFNTYRFADYKEKVIDLIMRVSVETVHVTEAMRAAKR